MSDSVHLCRVNKQNYKRWGQIEHSVHSNGRNFHKMVLIYDLLEFGAGRFPVIMFVRQRTAT